MPTKKMSASGVLADLRAVADPDKAKILQRFFKTGPGEYGEGDVFLGIVVPQARILARQYGELPLPEIKKFLNSPIHEARLLALLILVLRFPKAEEKEQQAIYDFYLESIACINNWDLVDLSAPQIVGGFLLKRDKEILVRMAHSANLWERRIAILATFYFIKQGRFNETLAIARILLTDKEDLIRKAVGWMLREVGKKDLATEENFLATCYRTMPRTMLRYAIERFPEAKRQRYLRGEL